MENRKKVNKHTVMTTLDTETLERLDNVARFQSRAEIIRNAVTDYLNMQDKPKKAINQSKFTKK